jgi:hypothetical protein
VAIEVNVTSDYYGNETWWTLVNTCTGDEVFSGGPYSPYFIDLIPSACLPAGQYNFTIVDVWGDGICCGYGDGGYWVKIDGIEVAAGGEFGRVETEIIGSCSTQGTSSMPVPNIAPTSACPTGEALVEIDIVSDDYGDETWWILVDTCAGQEALHGGPYPDNSNNNIRKCVPDGVAYNFTIVDNYGDGICCSYGPGGYSVSYKAVSIVSGGQFGSAETTLFGSCIQ